MQLVQFTEAQREKKNKLLIRFVPFCEQFTAILTGNVSRVEVKLLGIYLSKWSCETMRIYFFLAACKWKHSFYFRDVDKCVVYDTVFDGSSES